MIDFCSWSSLGLTVLVNSAMMSLARLFLSWSVMAKVKLDRSGMEERYQIEFLF